MDFSKYGKPSEEWLAFSRKNPAVLRDGYDGNDPSAAAALRASRNHAREAAAEREMVERKLHKHVEIETIQVPSHEGHTIPIRRYAARNTDPETAPVLLFFHGGGMLFGSETTDDVLCSTIAAENSMVVLSVIYRHTPAHTHPAQHNDAWDAFQFIRNGASGLRVNAKAISVMGISAGAGLAAGVVLRDTAYARNTREYSSIITGVVLAIPWLIHIDNYPFDAFASNDKTAKLQCLDVPVLPEARIRLFSDLLHAQDPTDPILNVALTPEAELEGWPKTAILAAGMDPLRDDALLFARRLEELG